MEAPDWRGVAWIPEDVVAQDDGRAEARSKDGAGHARTLLPPVVSLWHGHEGSHVATPEGDFHQPHSLPPLTHSSHPSLHHLVTKITYCYLFNACILDNRHGAFERFFGPNCVKFHKLIFNVML